MTVTCSEHTDLEALVCALQAALDARATHETKLRAGRFSRRPAPDDYLTGDL